VRKLFSRGDTPQDCGESPLRTKMGNSELGEKRRLYRRAFVGPLLGTWEILREKHFEKKKIPMEEVQLHFEKGNILLPFGKKKSKKRELPIAGGDSRKNTKTT